MTEADHLIVPLPLHAKRYLHRRFNQPAKLKRLLCKQNQNGIFAPEALTRPKAGPTQAGLSRSQRQRNLADAFAITQDLRHLIANRPVLLTDDVMRTVSLFMKRQKPSIGQEVARFVGWSWRVFCAMGCSLFNPVLIFPSNAMT